MRKSKCKHSKKISKLTYRTDKIFLASKRHSGNIGVSVLFHIYLNYAILDRYFFYIIFLGDSVLLWKPFFSIMIIIIWSVPMLWQIKGETDIYMMHTSFVLVLVHGVLALTFMSLRMVASPPFVPPWSALMHISGSNYLYTLV